jgi:hypothetical protein
MLRGKRGRFESDGEQIKTGLDQLKKGEGIPGEEVEAEIKRMSAELRAKRR